MTGVCAWCAAPVETDPGLGPDCWIDPARQDSNNEGLQCQSSESGLHEVAGGVQ